MPEHPPPIAVIGHAGRFPRSPSVEALWALLTAGEHGIRRIPDGRWNLDALSAYAGEGGYPDHILEGGWLDAPTAFDPEMFRLSPREARTLDPSLRLAMVVGREALAHAAIFPTRRPDLRFGTWLGVNHSEYRMRFYHRQEIGRAGGDRYFLTGTDTGFAAGRLHAALGMDGPAVNLNTQCSASLVAVHQAALSLRAGACDVALVGGTQVLDRPELSLVMDRFGVLSPDARCAAFDASARGYVRGEAVGFVVLRRLEDAIADGDEVLAVVRGSHVNSNGRSDNILATDGSAQERLFGATLADAGIPAHTIPYVQAHGTGTPVGDPIEARSLLRVLRPTHDAPLHVTSVKTQLGHAELAAGVTGLIATIEAIRRGTLPPHLHLRDRNPAIPPDAPLVFPEQPQPYPTADAPRRALVNSFGISGTNACLLLEQAPDRPAIPDPPPAPLWLAAPTRDRLDALANRWADALETGLTAEACARALQGLSDHGARVAVPPSPQGSARAVALRRFADGDRSALPHADVGAPPKVLMAMAGQGSQRAGMGLDLDGEVALFRRALDKVDAALSPLLGRPIREVLAGEVDLANTRWTQPALFALEWALAETWEALGVEPSAYIGHSIGEIAAASRAGVMSLEGAAHLVDARARGMAQLPLDGAMAAVMLDAREVEDRLSAVRDVELAADNGPRGAVVSGSAEAVDQLLARLDADGIPHRRLAVSHAFHSARMAPMLEALARTLEGVSLQPAHTPVYSNVTGAPEQTRLAEPSYWIEHVRRTVRFAPGLRQAVDDGHGLLLEVGPDAVVCGMARRVLRGHASPPLIASLPPQGAPTLHDAASRLWVHGVSLNTRALLGSAAPHRALPSLPVQLQTLEVDDPGPAHASPAAEHAPALWRVRHEAVDPDPTEPPGGTWLVLGQTTDAAQVLREAALEVVETSEVAVDPLRDQIRLHAPIAGVVLAGALSPTLPAPHDPTFLRAVRDHAHGVVAALQALDTEGCDAPILVWTRGAVDHGSAQTPQPVAAAVLGAARTVALEHPDRVIMRHDLGSSDPLPPITRWLPSEEDALIWRGGQPLAPRLVREGATTMPPPPVRGTWVVTGGTGGLGRATGAWLVARGASRVVLCSRSAPSDDLSAWMASFPEGRLIHRALDLADKRAVHDLLASLHSADDPVRGIVHAAGILADRPVRHMDPARFTEVFPAKAQGVASLDDASRALALPLDAFVVYSSVTATLGAPGQVNYGAANAAMASVVERRVRDGLPGLSLGWGPWAEVGMAARLVDRMAKRGMGALSPTDALRLLGAALDRHDGLLLPMALRPDALRSASPARARSPLLRHLPAGPPEPLRDPPASVAPPRPLPATPASSDALLDEVLALATELLGFAPGELDPDRPLAWQGLDSVLAVDLQTAIRQRLSADLPLDTLVSGPRPRELAVHVHRAGGSIVAPPSTRDTPAVDAPERPPSPAPSSSHGAADRLAKEVEALLGYDPGGLDRARPLAWQGFDSVLAVDLQARIVDVWGVELPLDHLATGPRLDEIARQLPAPDATAPPPAAPPTPSRLREAPPPSPEPLPAPRPDDQAPPPPAALWGLLALLLLGIAVFLSL